jgi:hypothetical protein
MMKAKTITGSETMKAPALIVSHSIPCEVRPDRLADLALILIQISPSLRL